MSEMELPNVSGPQPLLRLGSPSAEVFYPSGVELEEAGWRRVTHLGIGAHPDDLEILALPAILECFRSEEQAFAGVVCTDGRGSLRTGPYAELTAEELVAVRRKEQRKAAVVGEYAALVQLGYTSEEIKNPVNRRPIEDLVQILRLAQPQVVFTHNPADRHPTHVAVFARVLAAIRSLPVELRPQRLLGGEVWGSLDWLPDKEKVILRVPEREHLAAALLGCFDSQISIGKRYALAAAARRQANATFLDPMAADFASRVSFAMELTPLMENEAQSARDFVLGKIRNFADEVDRVMRGVGVE